MGVVVGMAFQAFMMLRTYDYVELFKGLGASGCGKEADWYVFRGFLVRIPVHIWIVDPGCWC